MESLPEISIPCIDDLLEDVTFSTESINNYISAIGSHISPAVQYLSKLLEEVEDSFHLLFAGG